ncbi:hypothetical protein [Parasediminibacterium sp. JCM 36343]|uniref:hypothetical protein n=1 Tax=Parasediminibacterium sp. JCM 36343 TaxID=3374279 RepID=UPI0039795C95
MATVDGKKVSFNGYTTVTKDTSLNQLFIYGTTSFGNMRLYFNSDSSFKTGNYYDVLGHYSTNFEYDFIDSSSYVSYYSKRYDTSSNKFTATILSINDAGLSGIFSGDIYMNNQKKTITDGSFNVKF